MGGSVGDWMGLTGQVGRVREERVSSFKYFFNQS